MTRGRWLICIAVLAGALFVAATPAYAEFESPSGKTTGAGENVELNLEAGGGTITCQAFFEGASAAGWTIESEGKAATKGTELLLDIKKWGECKAKSSEIKELEATLSECELKIKAPGEETVASGEVVKTCIAKILFCEIKVEAGSEKNTGLKEIPVADSGEENENLIVQPAITNIKTIASGCPGVKSSSEGKLKGIAEIKGARSKPTPDLRMSLTRVYFNINNVNERNGMVTVSNKGLMQKPTTWSIFESPPGTFESATIGETACKTKLYAQFEKCSFATEVKAARGFQAWTVHGNGRVSSALVRSR
jgi:hypothetical protein